MTGAFPPGTPLFACLYAPGNASLLVDCARFFSPHFEELTGAVLFDLTGMEKLWGDPPAIATQIAARVGIPASIALASSPDCAWHAARGIAGTTVIASGDEARALAKLPVNLLEASPEIAETFDQWGIRRFGELAALPELGVAARLGEEGTRLQKLARGEWSRLLRTATEPLHFRDEFEMEHPVELLEPLAFLLSRMLGEIFERLNRNSLAAAEIHLALQLENVPPHQLTLRFPVPMTDPKSVLKLLQLDLAGNSPPASVTKIELEAIPAKPRVEQGGLILPVSPEPEKMEVTIARIAAFVGADNIGTPRLEDTYRPDAFQLTRFLAAPAAEQPASVAVAAPPRVALRRFRPPRQAQVLVQNGRPARIRSLSMNGQVTNSAGPWRTSGDWWKDDAWDRDEWDVALHTGVLLRIYWDRFTRRWFLEGSYD